MAYRVFFLRKVLTTASATNFALGLQFIFSLFIAINCPPILMVRDILLIFLGLDSMHLPNLFAATTISIFLQYLTMFLYLALCVQLNTVF